MNIPPSCMVNYFCANLNKPSDDRVDGWLDAFAPECHVPNHVEQIAGKTSDKKPCLIGCEAMATGFVPSQGVLPLFYPVFDLSPTIVDRDYLLCFKFRVGHNKSDTWEKFTHMPFDLADNPSGLVPALCPVLDSITLTCMPLSGRTTHGPFHVRSDQPFQATFAGNPNEVSDAMVFAKLIEVGTGKCRVPPEPKLLEPRPLAVNQRRDKLQDAFG